MAVRSGIPVRVLWRILRAAAKALFLAVITFVLDVKDIIRMKVLLRTRFLPRGPPRYPILGSLLSMRSGLPHEALTKLGKQYGPMMLMYFGSRRAVVISSREISEAMYKEHDAKVATRPPLHADEESATKSIIGFAPHGPEWRYFRRLCFSEVVSPSRLNEFVDQRRRRVLDLVHYALETSKLNSSLTMRECMAKWAFETIGELLLGQTYFWENSAEIQEAMEEVFRASALINMSDYIHPVKPFLLESCRARLEKYQGKVHAVYDSIIAQKLPKVLTRKAGEPLETVLDVLLSRAQEPGGKQYLTHRNIRFFLTEMFIGGSDAGGVTLEWAFLEVMKHPEVLKKAQEELDAVVGKDRLVRESDLPQLPYIKAIVKETLRVHLPGPLLVPHFTHEDIEIAGYHVPADTILIVNGYAIHRDPKVWERPSEFYPERFLASDKNTTLDSDLRDLSYAPFGGGRRICPGRNLAAIMLQYCIAQMIHSVDWTLPNGEKPENIDLSDDRSDFLPLNIVKAGVNLRVIAKPRLPLNVIYPPEDFVI